MNAKLYKISILILLSLILVFCLVACNVSVSMQLRFVVDGLTYATIDTAGNEVIALPKTPTKYGYTFDGWYCDKGTWQRPFTEYSLLNEPLTADMSVYAKFTKVHTHTHSLTLHPAQEPTCTELGNDAYYTCACGKTFADSQGITELAVIPTIAKADHTPGSWIIDRNATCLEDGSKHTECTVCHVKLQMESIPATGHNEIVSKQGHSASCAQEGFTDEISCSQCGKVLQAQETIEALHVIYTLRNGVYIVTGVDATCTDKHIIIPSTYLGKKVTAIGSGQATSPTDPSLDGFARCYYVERITLPEGLKEIGFGAFAYCTSLETVNIPSTCVAIGQYAFAYSGILNIDIPSSVGSLGTFFVMGCTKIQKIITPHGINRRFGEVFFGTSNSSIPSSLKEVIFTKGTTISNNGFKNCQYIEKIVLPDTLTSIGDTAFMGCSNLKELKIPYSVTTIGKEILAGCRNLENLVIPFVGQTMPTSTLNGQYNYITFGYFFGNEKCEGMRATEISVYWYDGVRFSTFYMPTNLNSVTILRGVIPNYAFNNCELNNLIVGDEVTVIGTGAFRGCSSLTSITIPDGVESIGERAFSDCGGLESIIVSEGNAKYRSIGNCLIETESKTLILGCKNSVIPTDGSVTSIGKYAFEHCSSLTSIIIPDSVRSIGSDAFCGCSNLTLITIPDSVTIIGEYAFVLCSNLKTVYYSGTAADWAKISIGSHNTDLTNATRYYYREN